MKKFIKEFKEFALKGNVIDMAVGVIIGSAFSKIVSSLVADVFTPLIGIIIGGKQFEGLSWQVGEASIGYGMFIQNVVDFFIMALCVFVFVKFISILKKKYEKPVPVVVEEPKKSDETVLLEQILEELKKKGE
ncbi:MAG: large conductance mechanosensitive channel protein MscL [Clostridia bacterium]|nr:large conductance mechanosensitive channel protein MscL [Clostridia bacterium]